MIEDCDQQGSEVDVNSIVGGFDVAGFFDGLEGGGWSTHSDAGVGLPKFLLGFCLVLVTSATLESLVVFAVLLQLALVVHHFLDALLD